MEKEQKKNETKEKRPLTEEQRLLRRKMLVLPLMGLTFLGCMWLIFTPSQEDREKERQGQGFNTDMPQPEDSKIIGDKAKAYEQQLLEKRQKQRWATCPRSGTTRRKERTRQTERTTAAWHNRKHRRRRPEAEYRQASAPRLPPTSG